MDQKQILSLLQEAASADCTNLRLNQIQSAFGRATTTFIKEGVYETKGLTAGIGLVMDHLFEGTVEHDRVLLPNLFPVFAAICGDRDKGSYLAAIDWSVAENL